MMYGFRSALRLIYVPVLLLAPVWLEETGISSVVLNCRLVAACGILPALALLLLRERPRVLLADIFLAALIAVVFYSMKMAGEIRLLTFFEILRCWLLPYLMGRWCLASGKDVDRFLPLIAVLSLMIAAWSIFEAVTKINPVLKLPMAPYFPNLQGSEGFRWGLKRAQGPLEHPNSWGLTIAMLLPWAMTAAHRARSKRGPSWWPLTLGLLLGAILVTISRMSWIVSIAAVGLGVVLRWRQLRIPILVVSLVTGSVLWANKDVIIPELSKLKGAQEEGDGEPDIFIIDGKPEVYTGDRHRLLLEKVYKPFLDNAGWFGYSDTDTWCTAKIRDEDVRRRFASIDNHYMMFYLSYGRLGLWAFWALQICVLLYLLGASWNVGTPQSMLAGSMFGVMVGLTLALWGVYLADSFRHVWLFCAGVAACLHSLPKDERQALPLSPPPRRQLDGPRLNILKPLQKMVRTPV